MELETAVKYVAAAYIVVWLAILVYVVLIGQKVGRLEEELDRVEAELDRRAQTATSAVQDTETVA